MSNYGIRCDVIHKNVSFNVIIKNMMSYDKIFNINTSI